MAKQEFKNCQKCNNAFECTPGNISQCQCFSIKITAEQRAYIEQKFDDCLCRNCLSSVQNEFEHFKEKFIFK